MIAPLEETSHRSPSIDHIQPGAWGGSWTSLDNLATACWPCNARKGDLTLERLGWELLPVPPDDGWDGLSSFYEALWEAAGRPDAAYHRRWLAAFPQAEEV